MKAVPRIDLVCPMCGVSFTRRPKYLKGIASPSCSRKCNGVRRGVEWATYGHKGAKARTPESYAKAAMRGSRNPAWKGGVTYRSRKGNYVQVRYVRAPTWARPMARKDGYIMEHRLVMARAVGRLLMRTECVHHLDHDPLNNRPSNLELWPTNRDHKMAEGGRFVEGAANRVFLAG